MARTLVVGGAGRTGGRVTDRLLDAGHEVRVLSRHATTSSRAGVQVVRGDLAAIGRDEPALIGIDAIVISVEPPYDASGADAILHRGVATLATAAAAHRLPVALVSQIYITRPDAYPDMRAVIIARGRGEQALRASGAPYVIVRPGWLHDRPSVGVRAEQGDTGDGQVSRDTVADACVQALLGETRSVTFEVFDDQSARPPDWRAVLAGLAPDPPATSPGA